MDWKQLLKKEIDDTYRVTSHLLGLVEEATLDWKPSSGSNWMTTGQLILHITEACGTNIRGFVRGDWDEFENISSDESQNMLPPAKSFKTASSLTEVLEKLNDDRLLALDLLNECSELDLSEKEVSAPWDPSRWPLGYRFLQMIDHLKQHKGQLFYYLKLQGKSVNTTDLWPNEDIT